MKQKILKYKDGANLMRCPLCKADFDFTNTGSLICENNHCFDISAKGYINFVPHQKVLHGYDKKFFENRRVFLNKGYYSHITSALAKIVDENHLKVVLDAGCGEGQNSLYLAEKLNCQVIGLDLAKDGVLVASGGVNDVKWVVGDVANIPLKGDSVDCIMNVYTPANYSEFTRVLKKDGLLVKVIPTSNHLIELRNLLNIDENKDEYSNDQVVFHFEKNFEIIEQFKVSNTQEIDQNSTLELLQMTPLMFNVDEQLTEIKELSKITIEAEILVGKIKNKTDL